MNEIKAIDEGENSFSLEACLFYTKWIFGVHTYELYQIICFCFHWDFGGKNFLASNGNQFVGDSWRCIWYSLFLDETLVNFMKTMHLAKGEREDKKRGPKSKPKAHKPKGESQGGKGTNYVQEPPPIARNISKKEREGKPENLVCLKEPSPMMIVHLKIEATCVL